MIIIKPRENGFGFQAFYQEDNGNLTLLENAIEVQELPSPTGCTKMLRIDFLGYDIREKS